MRVATLFSSLNNTSVVAIFIVTEGIYFKFVDREKSFLWLYQMMEDRVIDDLDEGDGGSLLLFFFLFFFFFFKFYWHSTELQK